MTSDTLAQSAALVLLGWLLLNGLLIAVFHRQIVRLWREPVFRHPILIVESDDWGAGPLVQAEALRQIAAVLARHRDGTGRAPLFNLALVLAVPDGPAIRSTGGYQRLTLDAALFREVLAALREGEARGVFALQLHGLEHYWPEALRTSGDPAVRQCLVGEGPAATEGLPAPLQSRWVNAARLPSTPHGAAAIRAAVAEEVHTWRRLFGVLPPGVVPPTFVWTRAVEAAWAGHGIGYVVTPGWRYTGRNAAGMPDGEEGPLVNGDRDGGLIYVVRSDYFEPARGRGAAYALAALAAAVAQGRPCVLENHRDNFIRDRAACAHSLAELDRLLERALAEYGGLRFMSTRELAHCLATHDASWLETRPGKRLAVLVERLRRSGRFWKLLACTGLAPLLSLSAVRRAGVGRAPRTGVQTTHDVC